MLQLLTRILAMSACILLLAYNNAKAGADLYVMAEESTPPYAFVEHGIKKGIDHDIIVEAAKRMNIRVEIDMVPWIRMYKSIETGVCDAGSVFFHVKERESFAIFTNPPLHHSTYSVFIRKDSKLEYSSIESLYGKTIGVSRGYRLNNDFKEAVDRGFIQIEETNNISMNIRKVMAGRLDCMVANYDVTMLELSRAGLRGQLIALNPPLLERKPLHFVFSKAGRYGNNKEFIAKFESTLDAMKNDGTFKRIYDRYYAKQ